MILVAITWNSCRLRKLRIMFRLRSLTIVAILGVVAFHASAAQRPHTDSALVYVVIEATLVGIAPELANFVFRPQSEVWRMVPPDTTDSLWVSEFRGLGELLHAQPPRPNSDHEHYVEMHESASGDSVRTFNVDVGQRWRCPQRPGRWVEASRSFAIRVVRRDGSWRVLPPEPWVDGMPGVCM